MTAVLATFGALLVPLLVVVLVVGAGVALNTAIEHRFGAALERWWNQ